MPISSSNGYLNSLPTSAIQHGTTVLSIVAIFKAYFDVFMFLNVEIGYLNLDQLHLVLCLKKGVFIHTHYFMITLFKWPDRNIKFSYCILKDSVEFLSTSITKTTQFLNDKITSSMNVVGTGCNFN